MDYFIEDMVKYIGKFLFCILIGGKKKYGKYDGCYFVVYNLLFVNKKNIDGSYIILFYFIVVNKYFVVIRAFVEWSFY